MLTSAAAAVGRRALDLLFPLRCIGCGTLDEALCASCADMLSPADPPRCVCCWRRTATSRVCRSCQAAPPPFDGLRAAFVYDNVARTLVHGLKYEGVTALARPMARAMAGVISDWSGKATVLIPVPLSGWRRRTRGYNQAESLARALGREMGLNVLPSALSRRRHTPPQARSASAEERRRNVDGAFVCRRRLEGQTVLLLDDVTTTGSTLAAAAATLRLGGARSVWALAFARED